MLQSGLRTAILMTGNALFGKGLITAGSIASATGAKLLVPYPLTRLQRGAEIPRGDRVQYVLEQGMEQFKEFPQLILVGAQAPVAYFALPQALWTMARERLNITTVVFANLDYALLRREFSYLGVGNPGPRTAAMFEIGRPDLDWVHLAKGMGVPGARATTLDAFGKALQPGSKQIGATLIEVPL
jgi:hypothetical protein